MDRARSEYLGMSALKQHKVGNTEEAKSKSSLGPINAQIKPKVTINHRRSFAPNDEESRPKGEEPGTSYEKLRLRLNVPATDVEDPSSRTSTLKSMSSGCFAPLDDIGKVPTPGRAKSPKQTRIRPPLTRIQTQFASPDVRIEQEKKTSQQSSSKPRRPYHFSLSSRRLSKPNATFPIKRKPLPLVELPASIEPPKPVRQPLHRATRSVPCDPSKLASESHLPSRLEVLERRRRSVSGTLSRSPCPRTEAQYPEEHELKVLQEENINRAHNAKGGADRNDRRSHFERHSYKYKRGLKVMIH